jgi:hypothetical protein
VTLAAVLHAVRAGARRLPRSAAAGEAHGGDEDDQADDRVDARDQGRAVPQAERFG